MNFITRFPKGFSRLLSELLINRCCSNIANISNEPRDPGLAASLPNAITQLDIAKTWPYRAITQSTGDQLYFYRLYNHYHYYSYNINVICYVPMVNTKIQHTVIRKIVMFFYLAFIKCNQDLLLTDASG